MTMQHDIHPHDERLTALAGGDPEATGDRDLAAHVAGCDRCGPFVADLAVLRAALAELPDLVPNRPLQLVPPVTGAPVRAGPMAWLRALRGLAAPAMAAGAGLVLVGAVGLSGAALGGMAASGAPTMDLGNDRNADGGEAPEMASQVPGYATRSAAPAEQGDGDSAEEPDAGVAELVDVSGPTPWLVLLSLGAALLLAGLLLRFAVRPRAG